LQTPAALLRSPALRSGGAITARFLRRRDAALIAGTKNAYCVVENKDRFRRARRQAHRHYGKHSVRAHVARPAASDTKGKLKTL
jgi:hypothetical protein